VITLRYSESVGPDQTHALADLWRKDYPNQAFGVIFNGPPHDPDRLNAEAIACATSGQSTFTNRENYD
jgi:hypothetical protein